MTKTELPPLPDHAIAQDRRAGVCFPLWSLLSEKSFETGDIHTLEAILPWLQKTGFSVLQILPLNDSGYGSSPYSSLSSFAIDPLYISLHKLGIPEYNRKKRIATHAINKARITELKIQHLSRYFQDHPEEAQIAERFWDLFSWVKPYLVFKYYYRKHNGVHWKDWEKLENISGFSEDLFQALLQDPKSRLEVQFESWLQWIAYEQLRRVKDLYTQHKIYLKGDMPILTSGNSADVWANRDIYRIDLQTGAPPDAFSAVGQNWGFPILDWKKWEAIDYKPWKDRLDYQGHFFHLFRIDHVIGLYRLWAVPYTAKSAKYGFFYPQTGVTDEDFQTEKLDVALARERNLISPMEDGVYFFHWDFHREPEFSLYSDAEKEALFRLSFQNLKEDEEDWKEAGEKVLTAIQNFTQMFPCAEDLGSVPGFVRDSMFENRVFGIDVIRWTRSFEDGSYIPANAYRRNAISTLSTHDTRLALDWWFVELQGEEKQRAEKFFLPENVYADSSMRTDPGVVLHCLLDFAFHANSQFSIQLLQDLLYTGQHSIWEDWNLHKINTPATSEERNWKYRFSFYAEDLMRDEALTSGLRNLLEKTDRLVA